MGNHSELKQKIKGEILLNSEVVSVHDNSDYV